MPLRPAEILARCPLFAQLEPADLHALAAIGRPRHYEAGRLLFLAQEPPAGLHVVVSGAVKVFILSPQSGRELVLTTEHPYHAVAELPSFDRDVYPASAQALEDTETLFLEQEAFERALQEHPRVALHLLRTLGRRLRRLVALVEAISFQDVVHRLAAHLLERAEQGLPFELEANAAVAAQLGTVPELVSRNLARLHQSGAIRLTGRRVESLDAEALRELAASAGR